MIPGQAILLDRFYPAVFLSWFIERDTEYCKILVLKPPEILHNIGIFIPAGSTPTGPKIKQHIFAPEGRKRKHFAGSIRQTEFKRLCSYSTDFCLSDKLL